MISGFKSSPNSITVFISFVVNCICGRNSFSKFIDLFANANFLKSHFYTQLPLSNMSDSVMVSLVSWFLRISSCDLLNKNLASECLSSSIQALVTLRSPFFAFCHFVSKSPSLSQIPSYWCCWKRYPYKLPQFPNCFDFNSASRIAIFILRFFFWYFFPFLKLHFPEFAHFSLFR